MKRPDVPLTELPFVRQFIRLCANGAAMGFHERNGGNLSYWLSPEDLALLPDLNCSGPPVPLEAEVSGMGGEYFLLTASGSFMRSVPLDPEKELCLIRLEQDARSYRVVWGLSEGGRPTSELESHLLNFSSRAGMPGRACRVMYHAHPAHVIALSFLLPLDEKTITKALWTSMIECPFLFPEGVGVVPAMIPGGAQIGTLTSELIRTHDAVLWAHHGLFCCGRSFDDAFGLMETIDKAAQIYLIVEGSSLKRVNRIEDSLLYEIAEASGGALNTRLI
ncbi:MAG: rhamnulose-1-phosphate aldolase [Oscillospiraceae bacterium]|nr:rhamnulose-1-phosphate aldolase [Oscillospiraceae bacterium]